MPSDVPELFTDHFDMPSPLKNDVDTTKIYKIVTTDTTTTTITETIDSKLSLLLTGLDEFGVVSPSSPIFHDDTFLPHPQEFHPVSCNN